MQGQPCRQTVRDRLSQHGPDRFRDHEFLSLFLGGTGELTNRIIVSDRSSRASNEARGCQR